MLFPATFAAIRRKSNLPEFQRRKARQLAVLPMSPMLEWAPHDATARIAAAQPCLQAASAPPESKEKRLLQDQAELAYASTTHAWLLPEMLPTQISSLFYRASTHQVLV
ncbi:hypothetical protein D9M71_818960 [compost metagenome]